jgi:alpha-tubulin suppressor-like RCC1 family protein
MVLAGLLASGVLGAVAPPAQAASTPPGIVTGWGYDGDGRAHAADGLDGKDVVAIAAGGWHSVALTADGQVTTWGSNGRGQTNMPGNLTAATVTAISAGDEHSLALTDNGEVIGWGYDGWGQTTVPGSLAGKTVTAIAAGHNHSLALTDDGQITGWGSNQVGETNVPSSLTGKTVTAISAGFYFSVALTADGQVTAWGYNGDGQATVPASLDGKTVTAIDSGGQHVMALTSDGQVTVWGADSEGQATVPASLDAKTVTAISAGDQTSLALTSDGHVTAWGLNANGQSGVPADLSDKKVTAVSGGIYHSLVIYARGFTAGPVASLTGTPGVGQPLAAQTGTPSPTPDSYSYRWFADGTVITGQTGATFTPTATHLGADIAVEVSAVKDGYVTAVDTSAALTVGGLPAQALAVRASGGLHLPGTRIQVSTQGLEPDEAYAIRIAGTVVANGSAGPAGRLSRTVTIPPSTSDRAVPVTVTGSQSDRRGATTTQVVVNKTLALRLAKSVVRPRQRQWVEVRGLAPNEHVTLAYRGVPVSVSFGDSHAGSRGVYRAWFRVYRHRGSKDVTVTGAFPGRTATASFHVKHG